MGWIKLDRSIQDNWIWEHGAFDYRSAWIDLLILAAYEDKKVLWKNKLIDVKRGQYLTSIRFLAERWGWSKDRVMRYIALLKSDGMIDTDKDTGRTLITIENYRFFQDMQDTDKDSDKDADKDTDKDASRTLTRTKTKKERRKEDNIYIYGDFFAICWQAYPRKKGKGQVSDTKKKYLYDNVGQEQMLRCIERYKAEMADKDQQFMMYGSTFFNSGYVDYLDENYEKSAKDSSYTDEQDKLRKQLLDEYRHLCDVIPGCKDHNDKTMQSRFWQLVKTDDINKSIRKAQKLSVWVSQELQTRDMTLGGLFDELSSGNSGH